MGGLVLPFHIMAVTNYREIAITPYNGGNADKPKIGVGEGTPVADAVFTDDNNQPVDSVLIIRDTGVIWVKSASGDSWVKNDVGDAMVP